MNLIYAVIDTNVFIAALITKNPESATVKVLETVLGGELIPLYHQDILAEYDKVLHRSKFRIDNEIIRKLTDSIMKYGVEVFPQPTGEILVDMDDLVFYEVAMEKRDDDAYLVTGNQKHYPIRDFIVTPTEMVKIIESRKRDK